MPRNVLLIVLALITTAQAAPKLLADADGDGRLSVAEFIESRQTAVMRMDANGDRRVDAQEWARQAPDVPDDIVILGWPHKGVSGEAAVFSEIDRDNSGRIDATEANYAARLRFFRLDANRDGYLAGAELDGLLAPRR